MKIFEITLPMPPSDNHLYGQRGKIRFMFKEGQDWKKMAQLLAKREYKKEPTNEELVGDIVFYLKRDRDVMGSGKLIWDSFQGIVYKNDSQLTHVSFHKMKDKENPRVVIRVETL